jgi:hypothetical protein
MYDCMAMKCYVLFILGSAKPYSGITTVSSKVSMSSPPVLDRNLMHKDGQHEVGR